MLPCEQVAEVVNAGNLLPDSYVFEVCFYWMSEDRSLTLLCLIPLPSLCPLSVTVCAYAFGSCYKTGCGMGHGEERRVCC